MTLSAKHSAFIAAYITCGNASRAAQEAGYSPRSASGLLANPAISTEIQLRQETGAAQAQVTLDGLLAECEQARRFAENAGNPSAMVSAIQLKAKLTGRLVDDPEGRRVREEAERESQQRTVFKSAAEILSEAAQGLGLPADATPAQIVGASAQRALATPTVFELMREQRLVVQKAAADEKE